MFFDPAAIGLNNQGKNLGNETLIFHEALHGWTGRFDDPLLVLLHKTRPSCNIDKLIYEKVLAGAPGLDPQVDPTSICR